MWEDPRGEVGGAAGRVAHRDDVKDRRDETTRSDSSSSARTGMRPRRLPGWAVPVGAAVSVLVVVAGTYAATRDDSPAGDRVDDQTIGSGPTAGAEPTGDGDVGSSGADESVVTGTVTGDLTVTFTREGASSSESGTVTFQLDCTAGGSCVVDGLAGGGGLANAAQSFLQDGLALDWTGGSGTWTAVGAPITSCDEGNAEDGRPYVSGTLTVDGDQVRVESSSPEYEFGDATPGDPYCFGPQTAFALVGTLS